jgi:hypothetical protein
MDAAIRDELNALRKRAYGPAAETEMDAPAWTRLVELEDLALPVYAEPDAAAAAAVAGSSPHARSPVPATALMGEATSEVVVTGARRGSGRIAPGRWGIAGVAAATVATMLVAGFITSGGVASPQPEAAFDPGVIHVPVMIMASTGGYVDLSTIETAPDFPVRGRMTWAQPLGEHYGWSLWIGGADAGRRVQSCLLLVNDTGTRARCVSLDARTQGELVVSLPYERIALEQRPTGMASDESVRFTWSESGFVTIVVKRPSGA